jgi:hypothetical protein
MPRQSGNGGSRAPVPRRIVDDVSGAFTAAMGGHRWMTLSTPSRALVRMVLRALWTSGTHVAGRRRRHRRRRGGRRDSCRAMLPLECLRSLSATKIPTPNESEDTADFIQNESGILILLWFTGRYPWLSCLQLLWMI